MIGVIKNKKKFFLSNYLLIFLFLLILTPVNIVFADATDLSEAQLKAFGEASHFGEEPAYYPEGVVAEIIQYLLSFLGVIFIVLLIYAGFLWMTASGETEQLDKAKNIMRNAVVGILIVLSSYIITTQILSKFGAATGTDGVDGERSYSKG